MIAMSRVRWYMLALLFFATTVNYLDRILLGFLYPLFIRDELKIDDQKVARIQALYLTEVR